MEENTGRIVEYDYDNLYRLTEETITDSVLGDENISYTYGAFGNRLTKTESSGTTIYTYNDNDQLLTEVGPGFSHEYIYDDNGNTLSKFDGTNTIDDFYDYENRLISMQTAASQVNYAYDADGIRVAKNVDGDINNYVIASNRDYAQVLEETNDSGSLTVNYIYGENLISQYRGGISSYYHYDGQHSTRQLSNSAQNVTGIYVYDAFGALFNQTGTADNDYLYAGEQYDSNADYYYLRARYYDPRSGRFTSSDPFLGFTFDPQSLHNYTYAHLNPVM